ncbi:hypothetical protein [Streptomyces sp. NPDC020780]|uniref:hypothetical protein n=1 Tax=unclassified Streptomyces TaxID=2593676 RepID=UPI0037B8950E
MKSIRPGGLLRRNLPSPSCAADSLSPLARASHRRLAREYDHRPDTSASRVYWASIANMTRRLTTPSPPWRDTLELAA